MSLISDAQFSAAIVKALLIIAAAFVSILLLAWVGLKWSSK